MEDLEQQGIYFGKPAACLILYICFKCLTV